MVAFTLPKADGCGTVVRTQERKMSADEWKQRQGHLECIFKLHWGSWVLGLVAGRLASLGRGWISNKPRFADTRRPAHLHVHLWCISQVNDFQCLYLRERILPRINVVKRSWLTYIRGLDHRKVTRKPRQMIWQQLLKTEWMLTVSLFQVKLMLYLYFF